MNAMTLLQEEQEKPQSKAGPTRHAKIMRGIVTPIFGLLAIACIVLGVLNATIWKPSAQVTASASVTGSQYVVTDPNVLQLVDDRVTISASRATNPRTCASPSVPPAISPDGSRDPNTRASPDCPTGPPCPR